MASAADENVSDLVAELAKVRAAISKWRETGIIDYGIEDRRGRYDIGMLKAEERDLVSRIHRLEGQQRRFRRAVPVDIR